MGVNLSDSNLENIVAKAVIDTLTPETRAQLLTDAVQSLLTKGDHRGYGQISSKTPIQEAFTSAVRDVAERIIRNQLTEDPEFQNKVKELFAEVADRFFSKELREGLVNDLSTKIARALSGDRY